MGIERDAWILAHREEMEEAIQELEETQRLLEAMAPLAVAEEWRERFSEKLADYRRRLQTIQTVWRGASAEADDAGE